MSNPLSQFVVLFRDLVYGLSPGDLKSWAYVIAWTLALVVVSVAVYARFSGDLSERV
jgi:ABC-type polysaccharide/polyol phosphate export permease